MTRVDDKDKILKVVLEINLKLNMIKSIPQSLALCYVERGFGKR